MLPIAMLSGTPRHLHKGGYIRHLHKGGLTAILRTRKAVKHLSPEKVSLPGSSEELHGQFERVGVGMYSTLRDLL